MASGIVLGFDFGLVHIGVSLGNGVTKSARPLSILDGRTNKAKWTGVGALIEQWQPELCVVGLPRHPDGTAHELTVRALRFARQLEGRFNVPVNVVDERYSSVVVEDAHADGNIDDAAAAVILQQWFDEGEPVRPAQNEKIEIDNAEKQTKEND